MATKHQMDCYRMIKGKKFINWGDVLDSEGEAMIESCKMHKIVHRVFAHPGGFKRLFIREGMAALLHAGEEQSQ